MTKQKSSSRFAEISLSELDRVSGGAGNPGMDALGRLIGRAINGPPAKPDFDISDMVRIMGQEIAETDAWLNPPDYNDFGKQNSDGSGNNSFLGGMGDAGAMGDAGGVGTGDSGMGDAGMGDAGMSGE